MRAVLAHLTLLAFLVPVAHAQLVNPSGGMTASEVQALLPQPASTVPQTEAVGGAVGAATTYMRADAKIPRITRAAMVTTDTQGNWAVAWAQPLMTSPVVLPLPINTGTQPVICNVATATAAGATGRCWLARSLPATLTLLTALISYDIFGQPPTNGTTVQVLAIPPTQ